MRDKGPADQFGDALKKALLAGDYPNPNGEGCPEDSLLKRMATRQGVLPVGDSKHVHIMQCSPCYQRLAGYRADIKRRRAVTAAAAILLVVAAGYGAYQLWPRVPNEIAQNQPPISQAVVDLRPYTIERSDRPDSNAPQPLHLPASRVQAVFYLPVGVEPGPYELRVLDSDLKTRVSTNSDARLENYQTTIHTTMDLVALPPGKYMLAMRRAGDDWRQYPLFIDVRK